VSHLQLDWEQTSFRQFFTALAEHHTVVRYDRPGVGLSDRQRAAFTLQDEVLTLAELIDHLQLPSCALLGISCGGPAAIIYAQRNPARVAQLVLIASFVHGSDIAKPDIQTALCSLIGAYWGLGSKIIIDLFDPDMAAASRIALGKVHLQSATAGMAESLLKLTFAMDARDAAGKVQAPALVIHRNKDHTVSFDAGRRLASTLANARLVSVGGRAHLPWIGEESAEILEQVLQFTGAAQVSSTIAVDMIADKGNQFVRQGDVWLLVFAGVTAHIKDSRGLRDIALLLSQRNRDIHVQEISAGGDAVILQREAPVLDKLALGQFRQRLADIEEAKQQAASSEDEVTYQQLEQEQDSITAALRQALAPGHRQRQFAGVAERARKATSARIRSTIKRIAPIHPALAEHLNSTIRTGTYCSYSAGEELTWHL
jgi:pimeloyl-ACP methyl ester carboxylesterase